MLSLNMMLVMIGFSFMVGGNYVVYQVFFGDIVFVKGVMDVVVVMYKDNQQGVGIVLVNIFVFGVGYKSLQEYQQVLMVVVVFSLKFVSIFKQIGSLGGGKVLLQVMEYIQFELKLFQDLQFGFFLKMLDGVMGW